MASVPRDQVSASFFHQVAEVAWRFLCPATQQAIRESSSTGRTLHDSHVTDLVIRLGPRKPDVIDSEEDPDVDWRPSRPPTPTELRSMLAAIVRAGARVQCLQLRFLRSHRGDRGPVQAREKQLLAVMQALSGSPVPALTLIGGVPLSLAVAEAVHSSLPSLKELVLDFAWRENDLPAGRGDEDEDVAQYYYGAMQLLTLCGPRLTDLRLLGGVQDWPALAFQALRQCTALTSLQMEAGRMAGPQIHCFEKEATILGTVVQLTGLRSLNLRTIVDKDDPDALEPHARCMTRLSALTALTHLRLELSPCYEHHGDSWDEAERNGDDHHYWGEVVDRHRAALLSALRAMPQLQDLGCPTLWLRPSEAAALTALTRLKVDGLLPPAAGEARSGDSSQKLLLPPLLKELALTSASPRLLASLQVPVGFRALHVYNLRLGMSDVARHDHELLPETVAAMGPAVRLLTAFRPGEPLWNELRISANGGPGMLIPREGVPEGHAEWLGQLAGLGVTQLVLDSFALQTQDLCCLACKLGNVTGLAIEESSFPVAALSGLLGLRALRELWLDMHYSTGLTRSALETALAVLCGEAPALRRVKCTRCPLRDCGEIQAALRRRLCRKGKDGIYLTIEGSPRI